MYSFFLQASHGITLESFMVLWSSAIYDASHHYRITWSASSTVVSIHSRTFLLNVHLLAHFSLGVQVPKVLLNKNWIAWHLWSQSLTDYMKEQMIEQRFFWFERKILLNSKHSCSVYQVCYLEETQHDYWQTCDFKNSNQKWCCLSVSLSVFCIVLFSYCNQLSLCIATK